MRAKLYATGWELLATEHETSAILENIAPANVVCRAAGVIEIVIAACFRILIQDVLVQRYGAGTPGRGIWTAYYPAGGWGSCQCQHWRAEGACEHVDCLRRRFEEPTGKVADVLDFRPRDTNAPEAAPTAPGA